MYQAYYVFFACLAAVGASHIIKEIVHFSKHKKFDWYVLLWKTGGMPSSHAAGVTALTTAVFIVEGISTVFWVSLAVSLVIIRDAFGVRKSVSDQAKVINALTSKADLDTKVKVVLGHTPVQVSVGVLVGIVSAGLVWTLF